MVLFYRICFILVLAYYPAFCNSLDYPVGLEIGFLPKVSGLIPKIIAETGFLG